ncbi:MAG: glutathione S-transferase family protein [Pseudomonadota bacterium]
MYTVIGSHKTRAMRVLWALEELGLPYAHRPEPPRSPAVRALNPLGTVPVLQDEETVICDSVAILTYLADKHGQLTAPPGTPARARQDVMMQFGVSNIDAFLWTRARHSFILPEAMRVPAIKPVLDEEIAQNLARLDDLMGDAPFAAGAAFSIADIMIGHSAAWAALIRIPAPEGRVGAYLKGLRARPGYQAALAKAQAG